MAESPDSDQGDLEARVEQVEKLVEDLTVALYASIAANNPDLELAFEDGEFVGLAARGEG